MSDENQFIVPPSFIALFIAPGRTKPSETRDVIAERYEFCDDLATMLTDHAKTMQWEMGIAESDVLDRVHQGMMTEESVVSPGEALWVTRRVAELLDWPLP